MDRIEELTYRLLDDDICDAEFDELRAMIESDQAAEDLFCSVLRMEGELRGEHETDLVEPTMQRLEERLSERAEHRVMDAVWAVGAARDLVTEQAKKRSASRWPLWAIASFASVLLAVGFYRFYQPTIVEEPSTGDLPVVVRTNGDVQIVTVDGPRKATNVGRVIRLGEQLQIDGGSDDVLLRYADGTEIELSGDGRLAIDQTSQGGKQLHLIVGQLHADVAKQPMGQPLVIITPHVDVRVLGTRFDLSTGENTETRLELESGKVELIRGDDDPVTVERDQIAIILNDVDPIQIQPLNPVIETPNRQLEFRGVRSIEFDAEQDAIVAVTASHVVHWLRDGSVNAAPYRTVQKGKPRNKAQAGSFVLFEEAAFDRLVVKNIRRGEVVHVFDEIHRLPGHFNASRDRSNPFVYPARKWALSPQGDWAIGEYYLGGFMVWHCDTNEWRELQNKNRTRAIKISPDGERLALVDWKNRAIEFFNVRERTKAGTWPLDSANPPSALCFSTDVSAESVQKVFLAFPGKVKIFDRDSGELLSSLSEPGIEINQLAASPNGRYLAAACRDRKVRVWDIQTRAKLPTYRNGEFIRELKFSPDSRELALISKSGRVSVWDVPGARANPE